MKLLNNATGQVEEVPEAQVGQRFLSGQYGVVNDQEIHGKRSDGTIAPLDPSHLQHFLSNGGELATPEEARQAQLDERYGGVGGTLAAGGEGLVRGLTLGASDALAVGVGHLVGGKETADKVREHLEGEKEAHGVLSTGSEILGSAAPILLSGGTAAPEEALSLAARAGGEGGGVLAGLAKGVKTLGAAPRAVSGIGDAAEHAVAGVLGSTAETTLGRAAQSAAKTAVKATVEGGLFGAGESIDNSVLTDTPLTAEKMFHAVTHSALMAGALGGALGGFGVLAKEGSAKLLGGFSPALEDAAGERAAKWVGVKDIGEKEAGKVGSASDIGRTVLDDVLAPVAEAKGIRGLALDRSEKLELVTAAKNKFAEQIQAAGGKPVAETVAETTPAKDLSGLKELGFTDPKHPFGGLNPDTPIPNTLAEKYPELGTFKTFGEVRDALNGRTPVPAPALAPIPPPTEIGGPAKDIIAGLQRKVDQLTLVQEALAKGPKGKSTLEHLWGLKGTAPLLLATGHPLGAAGAVASSFGKEWLEQHGNAYAALFLDRLSTMGEASKATKVADDIVDGALDKLVSTRTKVGAKVPRLFHVDVSKYDDEESRIRQMAALSPALLAAHLQSVTRPLATNLPGVAQALQQRTVVATKFLTSKLPPSELSQPGLGAYNKIPASAPEKIKFLRYVEAVNGGPPAIMLRMSHGQLHDEDIETMKEVYPEQLKEIQAKALTLLADKAHPVAYTQRAALSALLGRPIDRTQTPDFMAAVQAAMNSPAPQQAPAKGSGPGKRGGRKPTLGPHLDISKALSTPFQTASSS